MDTPNGKSLDEHEEALDSMYPGGPTENQIKDYTIRHILPRHREEFKKRIYSTR